MAASARVQRILSELRELTDEEKAELETELLTDDDSVGRAWGLEVDRRLERMQSGAATGVTRDEMRALFGMSPAQARARLTELLDSRK